MTDIVERLRTRNGRADGFGLGPVCDEAADEIELLRALLHDAKADAAPVAQPLTDEQIDEINDAQPEYESPSWIISFARAIERAH